MPDYLHNHPEFRDLIRTVAHDHGIHDALVAKDYWIMHGLYGLKKSGFTFELKGGTSLSKGFGIIDRFSEDIDIRIEPPPGMDVKTGKNQNEDKHCESRREFYDWLTSAIKIDGIEKIERDFAFDDKRYRSGGIRLHYPSTYQTVEGIKPGILLEVGFEKVAPNEPRKISSWALTFAQEKKLDIVDNTAIDICCYDPRYTFVEKLQAIATKHRRQQESGTLPINFIRHYYDVMCLLKVKQVQEFIGSREYLEHKRYKFTGQLRDMDLSKAEAFLLSDKKTKGLYKKQYEETKDLYYRGQPLFEEVLSVIRKDLHRL